MEFLIITVSSVFSAILGIFVTNLYHKKSVKRKQKYDLFEQLMGNRYDIQGEKFTESLNKIFIVFNDSNDVLKALRAFYDCVSSQYKEGDITNQRLLELFKYMSADLGVHTNVLTDTFYLSAFGMKGD